VFHVEHSAIDAIFKVDGLSREARRRPGLEAAPLKLERLDGFSQITRRRLIRTACRTLFTAHVDQSVQERPGSDYEGFAAKNAAVFEL
jgi:hypothetical protein